jgi:hypothetical protein
VLRHEGMCAMLVRRRKPWLVCRCGTLLLSAIIARL